MKQAVSTNPFDNTSAYGRVKIFILNRVYYILISLSGIAMAFGIMDPIRDKNWPLLSYYVSVLIVILIGFLLKHRFIVSRTLILMVVLFSFGLSEIWYFGYGSLGFLYLYGGIILACSLIGIFWALGLLFLTTSIIFVIAYIYSLGILDMSSHQRQIALEISNWYGPVAGYILITVISIYFIGILTRELGIIYKRSKLFQQDVQNKNTEFKDTLNLLDMVISSLPGLFYMYETTGNTLVRYNENHWLLTGYDESEIRGMHLLDWFKDEEVKKAVVAKVSELMSGNTITAEFPLLSKDGKETDYFFSARNLEISGEVYFVGIGLDISKRVELERKMEELNRNLENKVEQRTRRIVDTAAYRAVTQLLRGLSHELNTPLGNLKIAWEMMSNALSESPSSREEIEQFSTLLDSNITKVIELSELMKNLLVENRRPMELPLFDFSNDFDELMELVKSRVLPMEYQYTLSPGCRIHSTVMDLLEVFIVIIENSTVHGYGGQAGLMTILITKADATVVMRFLDQGQGMRGKPNRDVFTPFFTTTRSESRGVGLTMVQYLVEQLLGGTVEFISPIQNKPEGWDDVFGSEVRIVLPAVEAESS